MDKKTLYGIPAVALAMTTFLSGIGVLNQQAEELQEEPKAYEFLQERVEQEVQEYGLDGVYFQYAESLEMLGAGKDELNRLDCLEKAANTNNESLFKACK